LIANLKMKRYVAFLRAINVAGHTIVRMSDLRDAFKVAGCKDVSTYIQSGNVIFESPEEDSAAMFRKIRVKLRDLFGSEPGILFRTVRDLEHSKSRALQGFPCRTGDQAVRGIPGGEDQDQASVSVGFC
jgi:uncharacterized protein (DUF1697 family)